MGGFGHPGYIRDIEIEGIILLRNNEEMLIAVTMTKTITPTDYLNRYANKTIKKASSQENSRVHIKATTTEACSYNKSFVHYVYLLGRSK